jgi:hypothetical protein
MAPFQRLAAPTASRLGVRYPGELDHVRPADLHDAWLFAEADATLALAAWRAAEPADKPNAHAVYVAALDRETHAAHLLELRLRPRP